MLGSFFLRSVKKWPLFIGGGLGFGMAYTNCENSLNNYLLSMEPKLCKIKLVSFGLHNITKSPSTMTSLKFYDRIKYISYAHARYTYINVKKKINMHTIKNHWSFRLKTVYNSKGI